MKKRKLIYSGRVVQVFKEARVLPNGHVAQLDIIRHPGAVLIIPFLDSSRVVFLKQYRPVVEEYLFELPAGTIDANESPQACAHREVMEEIGFQAKRMTRVGSIYLAPGYSTEKIFIFKAGGLKAHKEEADEDEIIETFILTKKEVKRLFKKGKIIDAKTIAGLVWVGWL
jgi:ADP-ribose pyrophosphatase